MEDIRHALRFPGFDTSFPREILERRHRLMDAAFVHFRNLASPRRENTEIKTSAAGGMGVSAATSAA